MPNEPARIYDLLPNDSNHEQASGWCGRPKRFCQCTSGWMMLSGFRNSRHENDYRVEIKMSGSSRGGGEEIDPPPPHEMKSPRKCPTSGAAGSIMKMGYHAAVVCLSSSLCSSAAKLFSRPFTVVSLLLLLPCSSASYASNLGESIARR